MLCSYWCGFIHIITITSYNYMLTTDQAPWLTWFDFTLCNITLLVFLLFWKPSFGTRSKCWKWADPWNRTLVLNRSDKKLPASGRLCLILKSNNYFLTFFQRYYNGFILHPYHRILPTCFILAHASFQISLFSYHGHCFKLTFPREHFPCFWKDTKAFLLL